MPRLRLALLLLCMTVRLLAATPGGPGLLYLLESGGQRGWLYGTLHVGQKADYPLPSGITHTLAQSGELLVEADTTAPDSAGALLRHGRLPEGITLDRLAGAELARRTATLFARHGIPPALSMQLKPGLAALLIGGMAADTPPYRAALGVDGWLMAEARRQGRPVREIEGMEAQLRLFDDEDGTMQVRMLASAVAEAESGRNRTETLALIRAWATGDLARLERQLDDDETDPEVAARLKDRLFTRRNLRMRDTIADALAQGRTPYVAVGALHLVGRDGLVALLQARGIRVTRLDPATGTWP